MNRVMATFNTYGGMSGNPCTVVTVREIHDDDGYRWMVTETDERCGPTAVADRVFSDPDEAMVNALTRAGWSGAANYRIRERLNV